MRQGRESLQDGLLAVIVSAPSCMRPLLPLAVLTVLGLTLSSELTFDNLVPGPAWGRQAQPAVAYGGGVFLVVWEDDRTQDLLAARFTPRGELLDPEGLVISSAPSSQLTPTVSFDGTSFVVAWSDRRFDSAGDLYAARVSPSGTVMDPGGLALSASAGAQVHPTASSLGSETLIVWYDNRGGTRYDVYGARLTSAGAIEPLPALATSASPQVPARAPGLANNGTRYLLAYTTDLGTDDWRGYTRRLAADGTVLDASPLAVSSGNTVQTHPTVASNGTDFLVGWVETRTGGNTDVRALRVRASDGLPMDSMPLGVATSTLTSSRQTPFALYNPARDEYLFTWTESSTPSLLMAGRVSPAGTVLDGTSGVQLLTGSSLYTPVLAAGGAEVLLVWEDTRDSSLGSTQDLSASRLAFPLALRDTPNLRVALSGNGQGLGSASSHGDRQHLVGWYDYDVSAPGIRVAPLTAASTSPVSPTTLLPGSTGATSIDITHGAGLHLVTWRAGTWTASVQALRVREDGSLQDSTPRVLTSDKAVFGAPVAAFNGTDFLVVSSEASAVYLPPDLYATRLGATSGSPGSLITVSAAAGAQSNPAVACDPSHCLTVWTDTRNDAGTELYGARVRPDFVVEEPSGIPISTGPGNRGSPKVAYDGTSYWVVWQDDREDGGVEIYGARVLPTGQVLDTSGVKISQSGGKAASPDITRSGDQTWVVWRDTRMGKAELFARRMRPDGTPSDPMELRLTATAESETAPALAADGDGGVLVLTARYFPAQPYATQRLVGLRVSEGSGGIGSPCGAPSDCAAGVCDQGMCVDPSMLDAGTGADGGSGADGGTHGGPGSPVEPDSPDGAGADEIHHLLVGCGCGAGASGGASGLLLLLAARVLTLRRSRRRRS